jgi:lipoprotein NlpI
MKHADKANEDVEKALEIEPNFIPAHFMKGMLLVQEGQGADAIQHLNMVITARPKMFEAYAARGIAYFYNDDFKNALRDLNTAIDNGYKDDYIYLHRGMVKLALGQSAISDFTESANNNRDKAYPVIWLHLAQARAKKDDMDDFRKNAALPYSDKWQATLIEFYLGKITEDELFAFLKTSEEPLQQTRLCEIHFYVAEMYFAKGNKDKAFENFKRAEDSCKPAALIAHLIKPELQALNTK